LLKNGKEVGKKGTGKEKEGEAVVVEVAKNSIYFPAIYKF